MKVKGIYDTDVCVCVMYADVPGEYSEYSPFRNFYYSIAWYLCVVCE